MKRLLPNHFFVLIFTCPDKRRPSSFVLKVDELSWKIILTKNYVNTFKVTILCRKMKTGHAIISPQCQVCTSLQKIPNNVSFALDASQHKRSILLIVNGVKFSTSLYENMGYKNMTLLSSQMKGGSVSSFRKSLCWGIT